MIGKKTDTMNQKQQVTGFVCPSDSKYELTDKDKKEIDESLRDLVDFAKKETKRNKVNKPKAFNISLVIFSLFCLAVSCFCFLEEKSMLNGLLLAATSFFSGTTIGMNIFFLFE